MGFLAGVGQRREIAITLTGLAALAVAEGRLDRAVRLYAVVARIRAADRYRLTPHEEAVVDANLVTARAQLGEEGFAAAWAEGQGMDLRRAVEFALAPAGIRGGTELEELKREEPAVTARRAL